MRKIARKVRSWPMIRDGIFVDCQTTLEHVSWIGGPSTYQLGGSFYDGKGQPGQVNAVSHGCPVARFHQINVLNTGREG